MKLSFGIDLGTTNSAIAVNNGKSTSTLTIPGGRKTMPSCVMYDHGKVIVGKEAYQQRYLTNQVVYSCKRHMGTNTVYQIDDGDRKFTVTPVEVSAEILKALKKVAEDRYEQSVDDVIVTVPAYFNDRQKRDTLKAAEMAGFKKVGLAQEPTSAALAYSLDSNLDEDILVYDLGGGTFDLSLLRVINNSAIDFELLGLASTGGDKTIRVINTEGDNMLGGDDFDMRLFKELTKSMNKIAKANKGASNKFNFSQAISKEDKERLILSLETLKKMYSSESKFSSIPINMKADKLEFSEFFELNPMVYEKALKPIYDRTMLLLRNLISESGKNPDKIVLVGGSTKFPILREWLQRDFPDTMIYSNLNPDESVALGAAIIASRDSSLTKINLTDIVPMSIGICADKHDMGNVIEDMFVPVIEKGSIIPCKNTVTISTEFPEQTEAKLDIYEGSSSVAKENTFIGQLYLNDIKPKTRGNTSIVFTLHVNLDGLVTAEASYDGKVKDVTLINVVRSSDRNKSQDGVTSVLTKNAEKRLSRWIKVVENAELADDDFYRTVDEYRATGILPESLSSTVEQAQNMYLEETKESRNKYIAEHSDNEPEEPSYTEVDVTDLFKV